MNSPFRQSYPSEISEVNVVPLADVSLVLLIILMVLSPMMTQRMLKIQAASSETSPIPPPVEVPAPPPQELVFVVTMHPNGRMVVGGRSFASLGMFMAYTQALLSARSDKKTFLVPEPEVPTGRVVHMIETLRACGASSVALVQTAGGAGSAVHGGPGGGAPVRAAPRAPGDRRTSVGLRTPIGRRAPARRRVRAVRRG